MLLGVNTLSFRINGSIDLLKPVIVVISLVAALEGRLVGFLDLIVIVVLLVPLGQLVVESKQQIRMDVSPILVENGI